jgi:polar amino acid transport system substrate-binding protein
VGLAFRTEDADLRDAFDAQILKMKKDGSLAKIMKAYGFGDAETPAPIPRDTLCK